MQELVRKQREQNFSKSARQALKRMQTDGLAKQLEMHETSSQFALNRLTEVLSDFLDTGRERFIQKLQHAIDQRQLECEKAQLIVQKEQARIKTDRQAIIEENKQLQEMHRSISSRISELEQRQTLSESRYQRAMTDIENRTRKSKIVLAKTKSILTALETQLSEIRTDISLSKSNSLRNIRTLSSQVKRESTQLLLSQHEAHINDANDITYRKQRELDKFRAQKKQTKSAIDLINNYIGQIGDSYSVRDTQRPPQEFNELLNDVLRAQSNNAVKAKIEEFGNRTAQTATEYAMSVQRNYEKAIREKEKKIDMIIQQARQRRMKLQADLDAALEQIRALQGSHVMDDPRLLDDLERSHRDFETKTQQLDETMSLLGAELGK